MTDEAPPAVYDSAAGGSVLPPAFGDMGSLKDKVPPHNDDAEQATLGALMVDWAAMADVVTILRPEHFYQVCNQTVYRAMVSLFGQSVRGDVLSVSNELLRTGETEAAGGVAYVASLTDVVPSSANIQYYVKIVLDRSQRRELIRIANEMIASAFDATRESEVILAEAEKNVFALAERNETTKIYTMNDVMPQTIKLIDQRKKDMRAYTGIPSGFEKLDAMTSGFQNSELITIGARPSIGKTALALSMMEFISVDKNIPCGFFSLEMSYMSIGQRLLSQRSRVPGHKLRSGFTLTAQDLQTMQNAAGKIYTAPLYIVDTPNMKLLDIRAMARRMVSKHKVQIIFIDYIGLITTEDPTAPVYEQVSEVTKSLKALARELDIPIVALCQVSRDAEGGEPNLAQLRGSGSVEQDSDVVIFIHRDRTVEDRVKPAKLIVAKQRNGSTGNVDLQFVSDCTRFENALEDKGSK